MSLKCIVFDCNPVPQHHAVARTCLCLRYFHCSLITVVTSFFFSFNVLSSKCIFFDYNNLFHSIMRQHAHACVLFYFTVFKCRYTRLDVRTPELFRFIINSYLRH